jgi:glycosyltransferase involved in cell wall biosynthesis
VLIAPPTHTQPTGNPSTSEIRVPRERGLHPRHAPRPLSAQGLPGLSIVLPCFNEEANVETAVVEAIAAAKLVSHRYEVIVVDDGSSDETARKVGRLVAANRAVRLVVHSINRGYGSALRTGIDAARMPWVLLTDSDLQFDLTEIESFLPFASSSDLIVGYRIDRKDPIARRANAKAWNWLVRLMFALPVRDVDCAFKLIRRDFLTQLELLSSGAMISAELIARSTQAGARLTELGVHHRPRLAGEQSGASPRVIVRAFRELFRLRQVLRPLAPAR